MLVEQIFFLVFRLVREWLNRSEMNSVFMWKTVRTFLEPDKLRDSSITGKRCPDKVKTGALAKKEPMPEKLDHVRSEYADFSYMRAVT